MTWLIRLALGWAALLLSGQSVVLAQQWVVVAKSDSGAYELDLTTATRKGDVAQTWMRETLRRPSRDAVTGKMYKSITVQRYDDCASGKFALRESVKHDGRGNVVGSGGLETDWETIVPGTVADGISKIACAATAEAPEKAILDDPTRGQWAPLELAKDGAYQIHVALDRVVKVDDAHVIVLTRTDYAKPRLFGAIPVQHLVGADAVNCKEGKTAHVATDYYVSRTLRVKSVRSDPADEDFQAVAPGSAAYENLRRICAAGVSLQASEEEEEGPGLASGTAWAGPKGYLITASHVVEGADRIFVFSNGERVGEAQVVTNDPANDLAILKVEKWTGGALTTLPLTGRGAALGKKVFTLGYPAPGVLGQRIKMTAGEVNSTAGARDDGRLLQISIPIQGGNSGGPVLGWDGAVVGVVRSSIPRFSQDEPVGTAQLVNYAVKSSYLLPLLEDLPDLGNHKPLKTPLDGEALVGEARKAVFMLIVATEAR